MKAETCAAASWAAIWFAVLLVAASMVASGLTCFEAALWLVEHPPAKEEELE